MMIEVQKLQSEDLQELVELIRLYENVFEMDDFVLPSEQYLQSLLDRQGTTFLVAKKNESIVGGLTAHDLPSTYFEANEVYIYDLAVAKEHQRKGIGKKLLVELSSICKLKGESEIFVQADADDEHALEFYRSAGGIAEEVVHFSYSTKE